MSQMKNYKTIRDETSEENLLDNNHKAFTKADLLLITACLISSFTLTMATYSIGPALPDLFQITHSTPDDSPYILVPMSTGMVIGTLAARYFISLMDSNPLNVILIAVRVVTIAVIPLFKAIQITGVICFIHGFASAASEVVAIHILVLLAGEKYRSQFAHLDTATKSLGGMIAPLVLEPFLSKEVTSRNASNLTYSTCNVSYHLNCTMEDSIHWTNSEVDVGFLIIGALNCMPGIVFGLIYVYNRMHDKNNDGKYIGHATFNGNIPLIMSLLVFFLFVCIVYGILITYASFLTLYSIESKLRLPKDDGVFMTSVFWISVTVGRFVAIPVSKFVRSIYIASFDLVAVMFIVVMLIVFAQNDSTFLWVGTVLLGCFISTAGPSVLAWSLTNVSVDPVVVSLFVAGTCVGYGIFSSWVGVLMESFGPQCLFYAMLGGTLSALLCLAVLVKLARWTAKCARQKGADDTVTTTIIPE